MAARENQGLQIALIIFVMLTIILSVTTFLFYRNFKGAGHEDASAITTQRQSANGKRRSAGRARTTLRLVVSRRPTIAPTTSPKPMRSFRSTTSSLSSIWPTSGRA